MVILLLVGCAPALYSIDMKYMPAVSDRKVETVDHPGTITVAAFEDLRKMDEDMKIGKVIKSDGQTIPVFPKHVKPIQAVTTPFKDFFREAGYEVSTKSPLWDLKEASIMKEWGDILVGGSIDELDVTCAEALTSKKYTANVKLTVLFANTKSGKIFHTVTVESRASLDHILFSEEYLEQQINKALSGAIEQVTGDVRIANILRKVAAGQKQ
jgi:hypothetical protein